MTQTELALAAGTSQPTVAAYESGRKSPTMRTLARLSRSVGLDPIVTFVPAMTREDRRSLALHRAIADRLRDAPVPTVDRAVANLETMWKRNPHVRELLTEWRRILALPVDAAIEAMLDPHLRGRDLRKVTPFAGVLSARERVGVYRAFARRESAA